MSFSRSASFIRLTSFILAQKLKALKNFIKRWNKKEFGRIEKRKSDCLRNIAHLDVKEQQDLLNQEDRVAKEEFRKQYLNWLRLEEIHWRQQAQTSWLRFGDNNTSFFHSIANNCRKNNDLASLFLDGKWITHATLISKGISKYYRELFLEPFPKRPSVEGLSFQFIGGTWKSWLEQIGG